MFQIQLQIQYNKGFHSIYFTLNKQTFSTIWDNQQFYASHYIHSLRSLLIDVITEPNFVMSKNHTFIPPPPGAPFTNKNFQKISFPNHRRPYIYLILNTKRPNSYSYDILIHIFGILFMCAYQREREGTLDCKLYWYPKFYNHVTILIGSKTLGTLIEF